MGKLFSLSGSRFRSSTVSAHFNGYISQRVFAIKRSNLLFPIMFFIKNIATIITFTLMIIIMTEIYIVNVVGVIVIV